MIASGLGQVTVVFGKVGGRHYDTLVLPWHTGIESFLGEVTVGCGKTGGRRYDTLCVTLAHCDRELFDTGHSWLWEGWQLAI